MFHINWCSSLKQFATNSETVRHPVFFFFVFLFFLFIFYFLLRKKNETLLVNFLLCVCFGSQSSDVFRENACKARLCFT